MVGKSNRVVCVCICLSFILFFFFFFFVAESYYMVHIHHIFFIHFSADGHLGCFHVLTIVNTAAVNIEGHVSFQIRVFPTPLISAHNQRAMDQLLSLLWGFSAARSPPSMVLEFREAIRDPLGFHQR